MHKPIHQKPSEQPVQSHVLTGTSTLMTVALTFYFADDSTCGRAAGVKLEAQAGGKFDFLVPNRKTIIEQKG